MTQQFSMTASHAKGKSGDDLIFATSKEAGLAARKFGDENVVNATIGALFTAVICDRLKLIITYGGFYYFFDACYKKTKDIPLFERCRETCTVTQ